MFQDGKRISSLCDSDTISGNAWADSKKMIFRNDAEIFIIVLLIRASRVVEDRDAYGGKTKLPRNDGRLFLKITSSPSEILP